MNDWIKDILSNAKIEDGKLDVDALMNTIEAEFPKNAVPKSTFNKVNKELKDLKEAAPDTAALNQTIEEQKKQIETLTGQLNNKTKEYKVKNTLKDKGVVDADYIIYKQGGLDKFEMDDKGDITGVDDILKAYKENNPYLFKTAPQQPQSPQGSPYTPVGGSDPTKITKEQFNKMGYKERLKLNKEQPELYKELVKQE